MELSELGAALADLIDRRAARGNVQLRHSRQAAEAYELNKLVDALDKLMDEYHD